MTDPFATDDAIPPEDRDRICALKRDLARRIGVPDRRDACFFFLRLGSDWHRYDVWWEPFRVLALALRLAPDAVPVVLVSDGVPRAEPHAARVAEPAPHLQLRVSPACPLPAIARGWIEALADAGAVRARGRDLEEFASALGLRLDDLGDKARKVLAT